MKIIFHLNSMGRGGAEHVVSILSRKFSEAGHEVIVATQWFSENEYELGEKVKRISVGLTEADDGKSRISKAFLRLSRLRECFKREKPDLVISFCAKANFRAAFSLFGMKTPLIVSVRNNPVEDYKGHFIATKYMEKKAAGCVFQTPDAMSFFSKGLQKRSRIIFNPLDEEYLNITSDMVPAAGERSKRIVNVGRISAQKNQLLLLKAFSKIADKYPDYTLEIYGDFQESEFLDEITAFINEKGLKERVSVIEPTSKLKEKIMDAALFVLSSDFEGMPNSLIEAMAMGIPSISTDCPCGGSRLLIDSRRSGILVPVRDEEALAAAMDRVLSDNELSDKLSRNAMKITDRVQPDKICREWEEFIDYAKGNKSET
ncbi:glycosyltransferase [Butyrivibrio sp. INlla16]|uniref:glycosyltransferase n=1 Tax=Butyrivibrio sp. INlla16 TaxID=1520807 RepID=UPI00088C8E24|nr:glycosyltransferase [Butyrivibrio sp. INlla16]SDB48169.1 Glycosyltransferase involved in cell wall bisynthesis [Butyrivibrio sp. INlla16]